jgi:hypothetical protein
MSEAEFLRRILRLSGTFRVQNPLACSRCSRDAPRTWMRTRHYRSGAAPQAYE